MVALHLPGVLVEVRNSVTVTVEGSLEGIETTGYCSTGLFVYTLAVPVTDGVEDKIRVVLRLLIAKVDVSKEFYGLSVECIVVMLVAIAILICNKEITILILCHTANDCAEGCKLVSVCDSKLGCISIIPGVVKLTLPSILVICNECNLREGLEVEDYVTGGRIVLKVVVYGSRAILKECHLNCLTVLYVVETVVTNVKTYRKKLLNVDLHYYVVILSYTKNMYVNRERCLVFIKRNVCLTIIHICYVKSKLAYACIKLCTCRNACADLTVSTGHCNRSIGLVSRIGSNIRRCGVADYNTLGPLCLLVILVVIAIRLACRLSCNKLQREALLAERFFLIVVACKLVHVERDCENGACTTCQATLLGGLVLKNVGELALRLKSVKTLKLCSYGVNVIYVNYVGEVGYLTLSLDSKLPLKVKVAFVCHLNVLDLGVAGFPLVISEDRLIVLNLLPAIVVSIKEIVGPIHLGIELTGFDNVIFAYYKVGEPREGRTEEHCEAKD